MTIRQTYGTFEDFLKEYPDTNSFFDYLLTLPDSIQRTTQLNEIAKHFQIWATVNTRWEVSGDDAERLKAGLDIGPEI